MDFSTLTSLVTTLLLAFSYRCYSQCPGGCQCFGSIVKCYPSARLNGIPELSNTTTNLSIFGNTITSISEDSLKNLPQLQDLNLFSNKIQFISFSAFAHTKGLETLNLDKNMISELQPYIFRNLTSLKSLSIRNNQIKALRDDVFYGLRKLNSLYLDGNKLVNISPSFLGSVPLLTSLDLSGNNMTCNCRLSWMKNFAPLERAPPIICNYPAEIFGRNLRDISFEDLGCASPSIEPLQNTVQAFEGDKAVELQCLISGEPMPVVEWYFQGSRLLDSIHYRLPDNGSLFITVMAPQLEGDYECRARNILGNVSETIRLDYGGTRLPIFIQIPSDVHVFVGFPFTLSCRADEYTDTYQWTKDKIPLVSGSNLVIRPGVGLMVLKASKSHSGTYVCTASNEMGRVNVSAIVSVTSDVITCDGIFSPSIIDGVRERVNLAFNKTREELFTSRRSPSSLLQKLRFPSSGIIEHLKAAEIFDQAVSLIRNELISNGSITTGSMVPHLSSCELEVLGKLSGCEEHVTTTVDCSSCFHQKYRNFDGTCNNLDRPLQGAAETPFLRLLPPSYEDGVGLPVGWFDNSKPSARLISSKLISAKHVEANRKFTLMLMQFGQFLDHDMDITPVSPSNIVFNITEPGMFSSCRDICHNDHPCFPIQVPKDDPRIKRNCLPFTRSSAVCGTGATSLLVGRKSIHREQINENTAYIDASMIYSSIDTTSIKIRDPMTGGLKEGNTLTESGKPLLPFDNDSLIECATGIHKNRSKCFLGGDMRANEQVGLTSMHTIFFREHNRIVKILSELNPHWERDTIYQETRKIVAAELQAIAYKEYLPKILGGDFLGDYDGYDPSVDPTIANSFAAAAFRFGHSQIMPLFPRLDANYEPMSIGPLKLQDAFFAPFRILEEGGIEPLIRGLLATPVKMRSSHQGLNNNLTEALFAQAHQVALDLAALNIQRGRDHGLPSYNKWRSYCKLDAPSSIDGLRQHITNMTMRNLIREVYGDDPDNIDLWVGGLLEDPLPGTQLGPTFRCIIGDQFRRLRSGDRFFYEREGQFSPDQLVQIRQSSLSRVICDNSEDTEHVPVDAFLLQDTSQFLPCANLPTVDLFPWKECSEGCSSSCRNKRSLLLKHSEHHHALDELKQKVSLLEEKMGSCSFNGTVYNAGESWKLTACTLCSCQNGNTICENKQNC